MSIDDRRRGADPIESPGNSPDNPQTNQTTSLEAQFNAVPEHLHQPTFTGSGPEFFKIWIVNTLLSLATLGIWSPWATVRNRRYLYGNTELAANRFDFHGNPWAILRGRLLAVILFLTYAVGGDFNAMIPVVVIFLLVFLFPWILTSALRFRLSNTSWRNLRFDFSSSFSHAYAQLALPLFLIVLALFWFLVVRTWITEDQSYAESLKSTGWAILLFLIISFYLVPLSIHRMRRLTLNAVKYGRHAFSARLGLGRFMGLYALTILVFIASMAVMTALIIFLGKFFGGMSEALLQVAQNKNYGMLFILYLVMVLCYLMPVAFWNVTTGNYAFSAVELEGLKFEMKMDVWVYWWYLWTNALLAVITLGLAIPWTKIRMLRYKLSCLSAHGELRVYQGDNVGKQAATGDEIGDAFDIDFGF